ncbi:hypothetical protein LptCag_1196 [Leptospirillum ferriphilum]|uniref:Uncharacterized protein n=1 Tax=Leptospirillum ferriphilum TaxID=178606 RepID=A0A094WA63_9BACT|nr:hypothetical protein LptCag_1196 [Leptospirillum ferriphilum]
MQWSRIQNIFSSFFHLRQNLENQDCGRSKVKIEDPEDNES